ncbi:hypothetical protein NQZ79_g4318 [Umbelopsis isabellina]|nr:hypothetical protein NQZ79_g4318 [Umbelopsis isabellina]
MESPKEDDMETSQAVDALRATSKAVVDTPDLSLDSDDSDDEGQTSSQMLDGLNINSKIKNLLKYGDIDTSSSEDEEDEVISKPKADEIAARPKPILPPKKPRVPTSSVINRMERRADWGNKDSAERNVKEKVTPQKSSSSADLPASSDHTEPIVSNLSVPSTPVRDASSPKRSKGRSAEFKKILHDMLAEESSSDDDADERLYTRQRRVIEERTPQKQPRKKSEKTPEMPKKAKNLAKSTDSPRPAKVLSEKSKVDLHKESERLYRSADIKLSVSNQPKKTMASFLEKMQAAKKTTTASNKPKLAIVNQNVEEFNLATSTEKTVELSDSDSDLEIIGSADAPITLASAVGTKYSPIRVQVSPQKNRKTSAKDGPANATLAMTHKDLNASLKQAISREMLKRRSEVENKLKQKGLYTSAEDLAKKQLERENEAKSIYEEVERIHGKSNKANHFMEEEDEEEEDGDYSDTSQAFGSEQEDWEEQDAVEGSGSEAEEIDNTSKAHVSPQVRKIRRMVIDSDDDSDDEPAASATRESSPALSIASDEPESPVRPSLHTKVSHPVKKQLPVPKSAYVENEAEEEEDEYMGLGGDDGEENDGPDEYVEDDIVVHANEETGNMDEAQLRQAYLDQMADSDQNMIQRLLKDVVSGGLRRRRGAMNDGLELDYYDTFDDMDDDLVALRRMAAAKRRKLLNGNVLEDIANNPQTAAFAKASRVDLEEDEKPSFSDGEEESQPLPQYEEGENDDDDVDNVQDEDEDGATFADTVQALQQSTITEETQVILDDATEFTEEPQSTEPEEDAWASVTITQRQVLKQKFVSPLQPNRIRSSPLFRSPSKLQKFKNLLQEAGGAIGGSGDTGSRVGGFSTSSKSQEERSASISSQRSNSSMTSASQESLQPLSRKGSRLLDILSSQESSPA